MHLDIFIYISPSPSLPLLHFMQVAYTFDAGPNAVLYCLRETMSELISLVTHYFPPTPGNERYVWTSANPDTNGTV